MSLELVQTEEQMWPVYGMSTEELRGYYNIVRSPIHFKNYDDIVILLYINELNENQIQELSKNIKTRIQQETDIDFDLLGFNPFASTLEENNIRIDPALENLGEYNLSENEIVLRRPISLIELYRQYFESGFPFVERYVTSPHNIRTHEILHSIAEEDIPEAGSSELSLKDFALIVATGFYYQLRGLSLNIIRNKIIERSANKLMLFYNEALALSSRSIFFETSLIQLTDEVVAYPFEQQYKVEIPEHEKRYLAGHIVPRIMTLNALGLQLSEIAKLSYGKLVDDKSEITLETIKSSLDMLFDDAMKEEIGNGKYPNYLEFLKDKCEQAQLRSGIRMYTIAKILYEEATKIIKRDGMSNQVELDEVPLIQ